MTNNPLVPTPIVNKNGVATTVYKRADTGQEFRAVPLPAPAVSTQDHDAASIRVLSAITKTFESKRVTQYGVSNIESLEYRFAMYTPEVIDAYDKAITSNPGGGFEDLLVSALHKRVKPAKAGFLLFIAQHDQQQDTDWSPDDQVSCNHERAEDRYNGIMSLDGQFDFEVPDDIYTTDDHRAVAIVSALITVTDKVYDENEWGVAYVSEPGSGYTLNNDSLIELIVRRPEDAERIAEIVVSRENPDAGIIEEILDAEVPPLSEGMI